MNTEKCSVPNCIKILAFSNIVFRCQHFGYCRMLEASVVQLLFVLFCCCIVILNQALLESFLCFEFAVNVFRYIKDLILDNSVQRHPFPITMVNYKADVAIARSIIK